MHYNICIYKRLLCAGAKITANHVQNSLLSDRRNMHCLQKIVIAESNGGVRVTSKVEIRPMCGDKRTKILPILHTLKSLQQIEIILMMVRKFNRLWKSICAYSQIIAISKQTYIMNLNPSLLCHKNKFMLSGR